MTSTKLAGKTAIVSGSGRGIGREIALKFAAEGANVVVNDLDPAPAEQTVADIKAAGGNAVACTGSVTEDGFAERFVTTAIETYGGLDIIVNNAGYTWDSVIQKMTDEQWDAILDVHLKAPFQILRAAQPHISRLAKEDAARGVRVHRKVVNISSGAGTNGNAGQSNYSSAKAGIIGLTKTLAKEWGRYNVNVNAVAYGLIRTRLTEAPAGGSATIDIQGRELPVGVNPQLLTALEKGIPLGRAGTPQEAAGAVYTLCIPESDYVSGQVVTCAGGW
ncbi:SDR family NAD(P)-dependent oxidoreductase [Streptomyces sp. NPDC005498]|uniref:SDR family NAD(P)-dependent oxidoreductase n=1 Tax=Streptomyces sp. NPDC005498 TaxID=3364717 RepID=UPI0036A65543